jgi:hypothetical protein
VKPKYSKRPAAPPPPHPTALVIEGVERWEAEEVEVKSNRLSVVIASRLRGLGPITTELVERGDCRFVFRFLGMQFAATIVGVADEGRVITIRVVKQVPYDPTL